VKDISDMRFMLIVKADRRTESGVLPGQTDIEAMGRLINVKTRAEDIAWASKVPFKHLPGQGRVPEIEVRQFFEPDDFKDIA
jgi:hypothetical protein